MQSDRHARSAAAPRSQSGPTSATGAPPDPLLGRVLDRRYRITRRIQRGGMATVYEAHDERLDRTVAVKVMHPGMGDDHAFAARFVREARAAAKLTHPHVVAVYDQGEDDGVVFLAMEYVPGETLRDVMNREGRMAPARALSYLEPILAALTAAHRAGLMHRDVKPENVLIGVADGARVIKVADFGLARAVTAETQHTTTGTLIGTVSYIAPELVIDGRADARADVYSAGVLLYELLTGRKPHTGESPIQVAYKHVHEDVPPPSHVAPGIPAYVDALVARATARDRALRPADAGVLLHQTHLVARALADGVVDDPDLVADLLPPHAGGDATERTEVLREHPWGGPLPVEATHAVRQASPYGPAPTPSARLRPMQPEMTHRETVHPETVYPGRRRRRRWPALVLVLVLLGAVSAAIATQRDHIPLLDSVTVPVVAGSTPTQATRRLEADGLVVVTGPAAYSNNIAKGKVVGTDPAGGDHARHGATITLTISKGIEQYPVPGLKGESLDAATAALTAIKMVVSPERIWSETVPSGEVVRTDPAKGVVLRPGHAVTVYVSKGRQPITVSDWTGRQAAAAKAALTKQGLVVKETHQYDDSAPAGTVMSQSPASDHVFHKHDTIDLTVSRGHAPVMVPTDLGGQGLNDARAELQHLGFRVQVRHYFPYFGLDFVMKADNAGTEQPYGSTVTIYIS